MSVNFKMYTASSFNNRATCSHFFCQILQDDHAIHTFFSFPPSSSLIKRCLLQGSSLSLLMDVWGFIQICIEGLHAIYVQGVIIPRVFIEKNGVSCFHMSLLQLVWFGLTSYPGVKKICLMSMTVLFLEFRSFISRHVPGLHVKKSQMSRPNVTSSFQVLCSSDLNKTSIK